MSDEHYDDLTETSGFRATCITIGRMAVDHANIHVPIVKIQQLSCWPGCALSFDADQVFREL